MMPDLVHQNMADQFKNAYIRPRRPFVQNGAAKQPHLIGQGAAVLAGFLCEFDAFVQTRQLKRVLDGHVAQNIWISKIRHPQNNAAALGAKGGRQICESTLSQSVERGEVWGDGVFHA